MATAPLADFGRLHRRDPQELEEFLVLARRDFSNSACQRCTSSCENPAAFMISTHFSSLTIAWLLS